MIARVPGQFILVTFASLKITVYSIGMLTYLMIEIIILCFHRVMKKLVYFNFHETFPFTINLAYIFHLSMKPQNFHFIFYIPILYYNISLFLFVARCQRITSWHT